MDIQNDTEYLRLKRAIADSEQNLISCAPKHKAAIQEKLAENLANMGHYLFDKEWCSPHIIFFDHAQPLKSKSFYIQANNIIGNWEPSKIQADPRHFQLKQAIDKAKQTTLDCKNSDYLATHTRALANSLAAMGHYFFNKNLFADAMRFYSQAKDILPDDSTLLNQLACCLIKFEKYARAHDVLELQERRTLNKKDKAQACYNNYYIYCLQGNYSEAEKSLKKCIKYDTHFEGASSALAEIREHISKLSLLNFQHGLFKRNRLSPNERVQQQRLLQEQESELKYP